MRRILAAMFTAACFSVAGVSADEASLKEEVAQLKARLELLEKKVTQQDEFIAAQKATVQTQKEQIHDYEAKLSQFEEKLKRLPGEPMKLMEGLELGAGATMIVQGASNVNNASDGHSLKESRTDGSYSAEITLSKKFEEIDGRAFLHLEAGQGAGLEDNLVLYSNVNRDADNHENVRVTELWYEQGLFNGKAAVTFGKIDPAAYFDQNDVANDETTQFLGRIFRNSPTAEFPDNSVGIRFAYMPGEWLELGYGLFDGDSDWEKIGDNLFNIGQVRFKTEFFNLPGNYRFYGWNSNADHTEWLDTTKAKESSYGFGLSFDQKVSDVIIAFCRYGWQNPKVYNPNITASNSANYSLEHSWSTGLQVEGSPWGRQKDILAFAVGQAFASDDYKKAGRALSPARRARPEGHLEAYYRLHVNRYLSLSPDFQYIWNPFGRDIADDTDGIFVGGMRAQVNF